MTREEFLMRVKDAKELGAESITIDGITINFPKVEVKTPIQSSGDLDAKDLVAPPSKWDELTDDEILFWSSGYGLELEQERKREKAEEDKRLSREDTFV